MKKYNWDASAIDGCGGAQQKRLNIDDGCGLGYQQPLAPPDIIDPSSVSDNPLNSMRIRRRGGCSPQPSSTAAAAAAMVTVPSPMIGNKTGNNVNHPVTTTTDERELSPLSSSEGTLCFSMSLTDSDNNKTLYPPPSPSSSTSAPCRCKICKGNRLSQDQFLVAVAQNTSHPPSVDVFATVCDPVYCDGLLAAGSITSFTYLQSISTGGGILPPVPSLMCFMTLPVFEHIMKAIRGYYQCRNESPVTLPTKGGVVLGVANRDHYGRAFIDVMLTTSMFEQ